MWQLYVFSFLSGLFVINGVPHFLKGINGQKHNSPFGSPSSATVNVVWSWTNFVAAAIFLYFAHVRVHEKRAFALFVIGGLLMSLFLANVWHKNPGINK